MHTGTVTRSSIPVDNTSRSGSGLAEDLDVRHNIVSAFLLHLSRLLEFMVGYCDISPSSVQQLYLKY